MSLHPLYMRRRANGDFSRPAVSRFRRGVQRIARGLLLHRSPTRRHVGLTRTSDSARTKIAARNLSFCGPPNRTCALYSASAKPIGAWFEIDGTSFAIVTADTNRRRSMFDIRIRRSAWLPGPEPAETQGICNSSLFRARRSCPTGGRRRSVRGPVENVQARSRCAVMRSKRAQEAISGCYGSCARRHRAICAVAMDDDCRRRQFRNIVAFPRSGERGLRQYGPGWAGPRVRNSNRRTGASRRRGHPSHRRDLLVRRGNGWALLVLPPGEWNHYE